MKWREETDGVEQASGQYSRPVSQDVKRPLWAARGTYGELCLHVRKCMCACVYSVCMFICVSTWISDKVYARSVCAEGRMFKHAQVCVKALKAAVGVLVGIYSQS